MVTGLPGVLVHREVHGRREGQGHTAQAEAVLAVCLQMVAASNW